jgi:O-antigen ligase
MLPTAGQVADPYRHRLAERGWEIVLAHPLFGDQFPWPEMEDLRQGEGIIDIVNSYLGFALNYGLVGLMCYLSLMLVGMTTVYARSKELTHSDPDLALLGRSLVACIVGLLFMLDSVSFNMGAEKIFYVLAALALAYARLTREQQHQPAAVSTPTRPAG